MKITGEVVEREGNGRGTTNSYRTSDGWAYIVASNEAMWGRLCGALDKQEWLEDERFSTRAGRRDNADAVQEELTQWFAARTTKDAVDHLSSHSVPAAPIHDVPGAAKEPHVHEREIMVEVPDRTAGSMYVSGKTIKFSRTPMVVGSAPLIGEHSTEILSGILGYDEGRIAALHEAEVVATQGEAGRGPGPIRAAAVPARRLPHPSLPQQTGEGTRRERSGGT